MLEALYKKRRNRRFDVILYVILAIIIGLIARLAYLQIVQGDFYGSRAEGNRLRVLPLTAARGIIYDRNGQILAGSRPAYTVSIMPDGKKVDPVELERLANVLHIPIASLEKKIDEHKSGYEPIRLANDVGMDVVTKIEERRDELPSISIIVEPLRYYPYKTMASQVMGYVSEIGEDELEDARQKDKDTSLALGSIVGRAGVERVYDSYLRGTDGGRRVEVDAAGRPVAELDRQATIPGADIHLTIDANLQEAAEKAVKDQLALLQSQGRPSYAASVVAVDPNTGAILAMVSYPGYDPNWFARGITTKEWNLLNNDKYHPFDNKAISGEYPPGSPFKIITGAAALELKKVTPEEKIFDSGKHWLIDKRNAEGEALGWIDFNEALAKSDNVYFYEMGNRLGIDNIDKYATIFGLGKKTGIKLNGEASGNIASPAYKRKVFDQDWYLGETFDAAIGQSYTLVTPLQMAMVMAEVANGGIQYEPYIVSRIDNKDGTPLEVFGPKQIGTLEVSKGVMDIIRKGLGDVTEEGGTAGLLFKNFPFRVAGKTGTAENALGHDHGWFVTYAPFDKPRIVVVALVEQGGFGSGSAGPIAKAVLEAFFHIAPPNVKQDSATTTKNDDKGNSTTKSSTPTTAGPKASAE